MINQQYLNKFGVNRYAQQLVVVKTNEDDFFKKPEYSFELDYLKKQKKCTSYDLLLYNLYSYLERIQRIDFFSKYYMHSFSPKARNINCLQLVFINNNRIFVYDALTDKIFVYKQVYFTGLDDRKDYLLILNDNRQLQKLYGDFSKMLSVLNRGHFLYNIEYVLEMHQIHTVESTDKISLYQSEDQINISCVLEIKHNEKNYRLEQSTEKQEISRDFLNRTSEQNIRGDSISGKILQTEIHDEIFSYLQESIEKYSKLKLLCFVDQVKGVESGFYEIDKEIKLIESKNASVYKELLYEYQDFTNIEGMNYWIFMSFEVEEANYDSCFVQMGHFAQAISILAAHHGLSARSMKNYNDINIRRRFHLKHETIIGYSISIFESLNTGHRLLLE